MILNDVIRALEERRSPILLRERKDHLEFFASRLARIARNLVVLHGGKRAKADREARAQLDAIRRTGSGSFSRPDDTSARDSTTRGSIRSSSRCHISWKGTLVQYTGRLHRLHPEKREVRIFDYVDREVPMLLRMFEKRLRGYRAIGYARGEAPLGYTEPKDDLIVEYDDDVLRTLDHESATNREDDFAEWVP
jgi:hypothetical protein